MIKTLKVGDKLTCAVAGDSWYDYLTDADVDGPELGDVVTVRAIGVDSEYGTWRPTVWLEEFPGDTDDDSFYLSNFDIIDE